MYQGQLKGYLDDLAGKKPAPGGGSAAACSAALGVSLLSMVANFTLGKEKYKAYEAQVKAALAESEDLRQQLLLLVDKDVAVYKKVASAYKLPKESDEDKRKRSAQIEKALKEALTAPFEVCKCSHQAVKLCPLLAEKGNINLISDVGVALVLLHSAFQSALLNVEINLNGIKDKEFIVKVRKALDPLEEEVGAVRGELWPVLKGKIKISQ
ncbi:MAG: cyclodeaminase/cyclohydrolase family protein [Candidatus Omnitrophica bacterium]|nr:cyclodeaminase/cyclohydrolase family protein [Candidatus Omnitrophota bacterium]